MTLFVFLLAVLVAGLLAAGVGGPVKTCGAIETSCRCIEPDGHDGPHVCGCKGSWTNDEAGTLVPLVWPGGFETAEEAAMYWLGGEP